MLIYVGNLTLHVSEDTFRQTFETFGKVSFAIISSMILRDKYNGQLRRFAFVEMPDQDEAREAIKKLNRKDFLGQPMNVYGVYQNNEREKPGEQSSHRERYAYSDARYCY